MVLFRARHSFLVRQANRIAGWFSLILLGFALLPAYAQQPTAQEAGRDKDLTGRVFKTITLGGRTLTYQVVDGMAVVQGDMILGPASELEAAPGKSTTDVSRQAAVYVDTLGNPHLWTNATAYYSIDAGVPNQQRILSAVDQWNTVTPLKILPVMGQPNYIRFVRSSSGDCSSNIGMTGGAQTINIGDGCSSGNMIHEIGHALGLLHEQSRIDRNAFVTVQYEFIDKSYWDQYDQDTNVRDDSYYDYSSIMHYPNYGFTLDVRAEIDTVPLGIPIGERTSLSSGDIDAASRLYGFVPATTTITTSPQGLLIGVDGQTFTSPHAFDWSTGSTHSLSIQTQQGTAPRYSFVRWTDGGGESHTFTAAANQTVVAAEFQREYQATVSVGLGSGNGTVAIYPASPDGYYPMGTRLRLTAVPDPGSQLMSWSSATLASNGYGPASELALLELRSALSLNASFSTDPLTTITSVPSGRLVLVDGVPVTTPARFQWTAGSQHALDLTTTQYNTSTTARYRFTGWDNGATTAPRMLTAGPAATTYTANFSTQYYLDLTSNFGGRVSTDSATGSQYFDAGSTVHLTATPTTQPSLQYWLGDTRGNEPQKTLLMDQPRAAYAVFGAALALRVGNAGTYSSNPIFTQPGLFVAPLEIIAIFGTDVGPDSPVFGQVANGLVNTLTGNTRIFFDGTLAPILYASKTQANVVVPADVAGKTMVNISIERNGTIVATQYVSVAATLPGLITSTALGTGLVAALNQNGSINSSSQPAAPGSVVTLYATGAGLMDRALIDGAVMGADLAHPIAPVYVRIGKVPAEIQYAGSAPFYVNGALQVNVKVPPGLIGGDVPIQLIVGEYASPPGTTLAIANQ